jgi:signal peptidase II
MQQSFIKYFIIFLIFFVGFASDQLSKRWATKNLKYQPTRIFIKNVIELGYTENRGMVFGINNKSNNTLSKNILLAIRILLCIGLAIYIIFNRQRSLLFHIPFLLILSGAIGNVIDSLRFGHVIDFIHMHLGSLLDWPFLYNLADAYICVGMALLLLQGLFGGKKKQSAGANGPLSPAIPSSGTSHESSTE